MNKFTLSSFATKYFGWDVSSFLKSRDGQPVPYLMVNEVDQTRIPTYPRFILNDLTTKDGDLSSTSIFNRKRNEQNIFNSSDFLIVNTAFGTITPNNGKTFSIGNKLLFQGENYLIVNIKVTIADFFNDYSFTAHERGLPPQGKAIPYNIVIEIDLNKIES